MYDVVHKIQCTLKDGATVTSGPITVTVKSFCLPENIRRINPFAASTYAINEQIRTQAPFDVTYSLISADSLFHWPLPYLSHCTKDINGFKRVTDGVCHLIDSGGTTPAGLALNQYNQGVVDTTNAISSIEVRMVCETMSGADVDVTIMSYPFTVQVKVCANAFDTTPTINALQWRQFETWP